MKKNFAIALMSFLMGMQAFAHDTADSELYLNQRLEVVKNKADAMYVSHVTAEDEHGFYFKTYFLTGELKLEGYYLDEEMNIEHGNFIFYHQNGQIESRGLYTYGVKIGVWERFNEQGASMPEKIYSGVDYSLAYEVEPDELPVFPGGIDAVYSFIRKSVRKPDTEKRAPAEVWVNFIVDENGRVRNAQVNSDVDMIYKLEAVRVISIMPEWVPGSKHGNAVNVPMSIPVRF